MPIFIRKPCYILFIPWHFPLHKNSTISGSSALAEKSFKEKYPAVFKHLEEHKAGLSNRNKAETGIRYEWYALQRCAATYYQEFDHSKILWPGISSDVTAFTLDEQGYYGNDNTQMIISGDRFLLGVLNSKVSYYFLKNTCDFVRGGFARLKIVYVEKTPIPPATEYQKEVVSRYVNAVLAAKRHKIDTTLTEQLLDAMVFELYFPDEVKAAGCAVIDLAGELTSIKQAPDTDTAPNWQIWIDLVNDPRKELRNRVIAQAHTVEPVRQIIQSMSKKK